LKALIVDDEKHVRDAIRLLVDWSRHGIDTIFEASDGQAAIDCVLREKPEIIMTDMMMPGVGGVELLEWLHTNAPASKTVVISGHDDFSLLRHTVKYGGTDYILKPIDPDQLDEALAKAVNTWRREEGERSHQLQRSIEVNRLKPVYWEKLLSNLLVEPALYEGAAAQLEQELGLPRTLAACRVAILSLDTMERSLKMKFQNNLDLLFFSLVNICNEFLRATPVGFAFRYWNSENEIVLLLWDKQQQEPAALLAGINEGLRTTLRCRLDFGIGGAHPFPFELRRSYEEARGALRQRNLLAKLTWVHDAASGPPKHAQRAVQFSDYEERIHLAIRSGSSEQIQAAVQLWIDALKLLPCITLELLDHWWREYAILKRRWVRESVPAGASPDEELAALGEAPGMIVPLDEHGILSLPLYQQELTRDILDLSKALLRRQQKEHNVIFDIAAYVESRYNEDITLQNIASRFFLSREYISRKFKMEFGVNLSDYLGAIRIDKAKLLLLNPNLRISQIAEMVGYQDEKYFSKVFKKQTGHTPNEFRKKS